MFKCDADYFSALITREIQIIPTDLILSLDTKLVERRRTLENTPDEQKQIEI